MRAVRFEGERSHEPDAVHGVVGDRGVGGGGFRARRNRPRRDARKQAAPPRAPAVCRHRRADVRGRARRAAPELECSDDRRAEREGVRLDRGLVLAVRVRVRVDRQPAGHRLAVRCDLVAEIRADDVAAGTAVDRVGAPRKRPARNRFPGRRGSGPAAASPRSARRAASP